MSTVISDELTVEPILQYPRLAEVGTAFLLTVDLKPQQFGDTWAYPELEEVPIRCIINSGMLFKVEFLGEPVVIVHRYGGTYSPARFLLTPEPNSLGKSSKIRITLANRFGVPMTMLETDEIGVQQEVNTESLIALATGISPIEWLTDEFQIVTITMTKPFNYVVRTLEVGKSRIKKKIRQGQQFVEWIDIGTSLEMVVIPAGSFMMGSKENGHDDERPQHKVSLPTFLMGKYPITQAQWRVVAALPKVKTDLETDPSNFKGDNRPVEQVSWLKSIEFCRRLSQHTGREYRLPSEAEWEYACRVGTTTTYYFGNSTAELGEYAWYSENSEGQTNSVRQKQPNAFGLYDMHGNVWEWCADDWHDSYKGAPKDGSAWINDNKNYEDYEALESKKLLRGGSWFYEAQDCRSAYRNVSYAFDQSNYFGFRVVCVVR